MDGNDREIIDGYFDRLKAAALPPRDAEAETLIVQRTAAIPGAIYYLVQAAVVSEHALIAAQNRVQELEHELSRKPGGFLGSLFGSQVTRPPAPLTPPDGRPGLFSAHPAGGPVTPAMQAARPSFLAGAMQTAAGVAGGVLIGNVISQLLAPTPAAAAESSQAVDAGNAFDDEEI